MGIGKRTRGTWDPNAVQGSPKGSGNGANGSHTSRDAVVARTDGLCKVCIVFDKESAEFSEGEEISGYVIVDLKEGIVIERLMIDFSGKATLKNKNQRILATEYSSVSMGTYSTASNAMASTHSGNTTPVTEDYFCQSICLYDRAKHGNEMMVASGSHSYPFSVAVPLQVPSSLRGRYGSIDYVAIATLERLWQPNETVSKGMKITSVLDLNTLPYHVLEPMESHKAQRCGFMCFCSGDICATLRLSRAAFIPGEVIRLNGEVANNCGLRLKRTSFQLIQTVRCHDEYGRSSVDEHSVALVEKVEGVPSGSVEFWREQMKVPTVPPSGQKYCNAMDLGYSLRFTASTFFSPVAMEMDIEIVIGTVALNEPENIETNFYGEYFTSSYPDFNSTGSASPITGSDNSGLDLTYFI